MQPTEIEQQALVTVVHLGPEYGTLDVDAIEAMEGDLLRLVEEIDPPHLVLDCWNTEYFGSLFISVLVHCYRRIRERGGRFVLCCLQPLIRQELEAVNLHVLWPIYDSIEEAIRSITETKMNPRRT